MTDMNLKREKHRHLLSSLWMKMIEAQHEGLVDVEDYYRTKWATAFEIWKIYYGEEDYD